MKILDWIKKNKHYIIIGLVLLVVVAFLLKSNLPKRFLKNLIKTYEVEFEQKQKELDSVQKLRAKDSIEYFKAILIKDFEILEIQERLESANNKIRQNEKELNSYRNGNFNERFGKFTKLITVTDSL